MKRIFFIFCFVPFCSFSAGEYQTQLNDLVSTLWAVRNDLSQQYSVSSDIRSSLNSVHTDVESLLEFLQSIDSKIVDRDYSSVLSSIDSKLGDFDFDSLADSLRHCSKVSGNEVLI